MSQLDPQFHQQLTNNLSTNNTQRSAAEHQLTQYKEQQPQQYVVQLAVAATTPTADESVRVLALVLLRQACVLTSPLWDKLDRPTQQGIQQQLLQLLAPTAQTSTNLTYKAVGTIAVIAARYNENLQQQWPDLLHVVLQDNIRKDAQLKLLHSLAEYSITALESQLPTVLRIVTSGLQYKSSNTDEQSTIQLSALQATIQLLLVLNTDQLAHLQDIVPLLFTTLGNAYTLGDETVIRTAMESLIGLAQEQPQFLKKHLTPIISAVASIATNSDNLDSATRRSALEFLVTLCEAACELRWKNLNSLASQVLPLAVSFTTELEDDSSWLTDFTSTDDGSVVGSVENSAGDDDETSETYKFGVEAIARLADSFGAKVTGKIITPVVSQQLKAQSWQQRHSAFAILSAITEGCQTLIQAQLATYTQQCIQSATTDQHPRVRYAAATAVATFCTILSPEVQVATHTVLIPGLLHMAANDNQLKLVRHACLCLVNVSNGLANDDDEEEPSDELPDLLDLYRDSVLQTLLNIVQHQSKPEVQEAALRAVSSLAVASQQKIGTYYDLLMNGIKQIVSNATAPEQRKLRATAIKSIGLLARASGSDKFAPDAQPMIEACLSLQTQLQSSDEEYQSVSETISLMAQVMQQAFVPYLPRVIPQLLQSAGIKDAAAFLDADDETAKQLTKTAGFENVTVDLKALGTKQISINTSLVQEKASATSLLFVYANSLGALYYPYVEVTVQTLLPNLRYAYSEQIRAAATAAIPKLFTSAALYFDSQPNSAEQKAQYMQQLWSAVAEPMNTAIRGEVELDSVAALIDAYCDALEQLTFAIPQPHLDMTHETFRVISDDATQRITRRITGRSGNDEADAEQEEEVDDQKLAEDEEADNEILGGLYRLHTLLLKRNGPAYITSFDSQISAIYLRMLSQPDIEPLLTTGLCVLSQMVNDVGMDQHTARYIDSLMNAALPALQSSENDLRQAANYTVGVVATAKQQTFAPALSVTLKALTQQLSIKNARSDDNEPASTNAISAIGKIARHAMTPTSTGKAPYEQLSTLLPMWLGYLPCKVTGDQDEAIQVHEQLFWFMEHRSTELLGANNQHAQQLVKVLVQLTATPDLLSTSTKGKLASALQSLSTQAPFSAALQHVGKAEQQHVQSFLTAQQTPTVG